MYIKRSSWRFTLKTRLTPSTNPRQRLFPPQWLQTCLVSPMFFPPRVCGMYRRVRRLSAAFVRFPNGSRSRAAGGGGFHRQEGRRNEIPAAPCLLHLRLVECSLYLDTDHAVEEEADQVARPAQNEEVQAQQRARPRLQDEVQVAVEADVPPSHHADAFARERHAVDRDLSLPNVEIQHSGVELIPCLKEFAGI